jgi:hypothetical protein
MRYSNYQLLLKIDTAPVMPLEVVLETGSSRVPRQQLSRLVFKHEEELGRWVLLASLEFEWRSLRAFSLQVSELDKPALWQARVRELALHHPKKATRLDIGPKHSLLLKTQVPSAHEEMVQILLRGHILVPADRACVIYQIGLFRKVFEVPVKEGTLSFNESFLMADQDLYSVETLKVELDGKLAAVVQVVNQECRLKNEKVRLVAIRNVTEIVSIPYALKEPGELPSLALCIDMSCSNGELGSGYPSLHEGDYERILAGLFDLPCQLAQPISLLAFALLD